MKHLILFTLFITSSIFTKAITFGGPSNDHGRKVIRTSDNGYALLCEYADLSNDLYIVKLDAAANLQWTKQIGKIFDDYAGDIFQTTDSGFVVIGTTSVGLGGLNAWLIRLNSSGDTLWTKTIGNDPNSIYQGVFVEGNGSSQFTIGVISNDFTAASELFIMRTDTSGNIIDTLCSTSYGQSVTKSSGDYVITGISNVFTPDATTLAHYDSAGNTIFMNIFFDPNLLLDVSGFSTTTCGNGLMTAGSTNLYTSSPNLTEFYLLKTDSNGDSLWSKHWGDSNSVLTFIINNGNDEFFTAGYTEASGIRDNFIMKIDSTGDTLWTKNIGHELSVNAIMITEYGFAVVGDSLNSSTTDIWFIRYDSLGNEIDSTITDISKFIDEDEISIYPNPAANSITVCMEDLDRMMHVTIENFSGQIVYTGRMDSNSMKIDISHFATGNYLLKLDDGNKISVRKFIKR